jgi:hypothetical protein
MRLALVLLAILALAGCTMPGAPQPTPTPGEPSIMGNPINFPCAGSYIGAVPGWR